MRGWRGWRSVFLIVGILILSGPLLTRHANSQEQSATATPLPTTTPDLLTELRATDNATVEATSVLDLSDLHDATGKLFPQPIVDHGALTNGQAINEDPGTEHKTYLYHLDAKTGDHLSFSMVGSPKLQPTWHCLMPIHVNR